MSLQWCLLVFHNSSKPTGTTQPSFPLTISGALLRSSGYTPVPVLLYSPTEGFSGRLSTKVQLPHFGNHFIFNLMSSIRPTTRLALRAPCQAVLTFTPLWSVPSYGSPHSIPSQAPAPVTLPFPYFPCTWSFCCHLSVTLEVFS